MSALNLKKRHLDTLHKTDSLLTDEGGKNAGLLGGPWTMSQVTNSTQPNPHRHQTLSRLSDDLAFTEKVWIYKNH